MVGFTRRSRWRSAFGALLLALFTSTAAVSAASPAPNLVPDAAGASISNPALGAGLAAFAQQYIGYPYAWAGNTPAGFDCSGFAEFVVLNVAGYDIGHGLAGQTTAGAWVAWGAWQPGDLVFFQDTYQAGLSHVAIYIGDGLIVHAENEATGVTVSRLTSGYYGPRYWGAVRVGG